MRNVKLGVLLLGLLAVAAGPAAAQSKDDESGIFIGGSIGAAQYRTACNDLASFTCRSEDAAYRAFAGYQFNKYWAFELGYSDLGPVTGDDGAGTSFVLRNKAIDGAAVVYIPITQRLSVLGKLGIFSTRTTFEATTAGVQTADAGSTNVNYTAGVGLQYNLGILGFRADWQRFDNAGKNGPTVEDDIDFFSVGLVIRFF